MSLNVIGWTLAIAVAASVPQEPPSACDTVAQTSIDRAQTDVARGEFAAAAERLRGAYEAAGACSTVRVAAWAWRGWMAAAEAARRGGPPEALREVGEAIEAVGALGGSRSEAGYAVALLRAASAAAQHERDELTVWLEEARARAARLALVGPSPFWPLPIELAEGELWLGVDDYELAASAFTHALAARETAVVWRGLARVRDRQGNRPGACDAYRHVRARLAGDPVPGALAAEADRYLLRCAP